MPFIASGIYIDTCEKSYEVESSYYLEFQIKSALISIEKLGGIFDTDFDNKYQYYHYYTDHLLYSLGQIGNRFISTDKDKGINLERKQANCKNFEFSADRYPILSDKKGRNTVEHIDEHNQRVIMNHKGVGGFNLIDADTETELVNVFRNNRELHPYTLDLVNREILIVRQGNEINIKLDELRQELLSLHSRVTYVMNTIKDGF